SRGSSHGSSRIFRRAYPDPFYVELTGRAHDEWARLEDESGVRLRTQTGGLDAGPHHAHRIHETLIAHGVDASLLPAREVAERWPGIALQGEACFHADAGHLDADLTVATLLRLAVGGGAVLRERSTVIRVEPVADGLLVHTESASAHVGTVVVAAGAWLPELLAGLPVTPELPTLAVKQVEVFHHRQRDPAATWPTLVHEDEIVLYALASGSDGGPAPAYKIGQFDSDCTTTATTRDGVIDDRPRRAVRSFVERQLPGLDPVPLAEMSCLFTMTPDEDFVLDRVPAGGGSVVIASPCSGHGAKFAPLTGVLVAELVEGARPQPRFAFRTDTSAGGHA
ncbi:MAG: FAD-dependent oxidoreductase, partial [Marmoricola sp.]